MKNCPHCGRKVDDSDTFCVHCGGNLTGSDAIPQKTVKKKVNWMPIIAVTVVFLLVAFSAVFMLTGGMDFNQKTTIDAKITVNNITVILDPDASPEDQLYAFDDGYYHVYATFKVDGQDVVTTEEILISAENGRCISHIDPIEIKNLKKDYTIVIFLYAMINEEKDPTSDNILDICDDNTDGKGEHGVSGVMINKVWEGQQYDTYHLVGDTYPKGDFSFTIEYTEHNHIW